MGSDHRIEVAKADVKIVGYCLTTINNGSAEIESIHIENSYRRKKIGENLIKNALKWINDKNISKIVVGVAAGNEEVFDFYKKFGFYPRTTILQQDAKDITFKPKLDKE